MNKVNLHTGGSVRKINSDWFTAKTHMKEIGDMLKIKEQKVYHVYFKNGSRTKLHRHNGSQILIAMHGNGSLETFKMLESKRRNFKIKRMQKTQLKCGDIVYIPAKTLHTHGSTSTRNVFSHIAINILPGKGSQYKTTWYESDFKDLVTGIIK